LVQILSKTDGLLANACGGVFLSKKVADEFDLFQVTRAPGANQQM
jgi:hypothetical protein